MNSELRHKIVAEAKTWLRTPFHHHAAVKGVGVDCANLIREVYVACGISIDGVEYYPRDWHLHRDEERFLQMVSKYADPIQESELLPADVILWKFGRCFSHGAIYIGDGMLVHAVAMARSAIYSRLGEEEWSKREHRCFRVRHV